MKKKYAYYNEFNPFAAQWLRNLIEDDLIAPGEVDQRSIADVEASDLKGFGQCHFFAGIGGWSLALRLAGWPDDRPVWTGSCPCQPFSSAGLKKGSKDRRDLWPTLGRLIIESRPGIVFGEQVASAIRYGWLDRVGADLEAADYAVAAAVLSADAVGAIHRRCRLWWVAIADAAGNRPRRLVEAPEEGIPAIERLTGPRVAGRWWTSAGWHARKPTLSRRHDGLSKILGGLGNAIMPHVGARFIAACMDRATA